MNVLHKDIILHTISLPKQAKGGVLDQKPCAASCYYIFVGEKVKASRAALHDTHEGGVCLFGVWIDGRPRQGDKVNFLNQDCLGVSGVERRDS